MTWRFQTCVAVLLVLSFAVATPVLASPIISIGHGRPTSWQDAIDNGNVKPVIPAGVNGVSDQANIFYDNSVTGSGGLAQSYQGVPVVPNGLIALPNVDIQGVQRDALVMQWDPRDMGNFPDDLGIAAWEYEYDVDPDLTGTVIDFSIGPPPPGPMGPPPGMNNNIWDLSFELVDDQGRVRSWFLSNPQTGWANHTILPNVLANQGPWFYQGETAGFDITKVLLLQFDSAVLNNPLWPMPPPPPGVVATAWDWAPFDHLEVRFIPEPSAFSLLALGLLSLGMIGRRRRCR
jgi:hypothetical protein